MTRQALLLTGLLFAQPALAQPGPSGGEAAQGAGLFGTAVSVAMGSQSSVAMMDRGRGGLRTSYRHHGLPRRGASRPDSTPHVAGADFSADMPIDVAPVAKVPGVTAQDLAAALAPQ